MFALPFKTQMLTNTTHTSISVAANSWDYLPMVMCGVCLCGWQQATSMQDDQIKHFDVFF